MRKKWILLIGLVGLVVCLLLVNSTKLVGSNRVTIEDFQDNTGYTIVSVYTKEGLLPVRVTRAEIRANEAVLSETSTPFDWKLRASQDPERARVVQKDGYVDIENTKPLIGLPVMDDFYLVGAIQSKTLTGEKKTYLLEVEYSVLGWRKTSQHMLRGY